MITTLLTLSILLILLSSLSFIQHQHWVFRVPEFLKLQILVLQVPTVIILFIVMEKGTLFWLLQSVQTILIAYHAYILSRYTKFWRTQKIKKSPTASEKIKIISCNVYQFNREFNRFIELIRIEKPDIFITMESNSEWEMAMKELEEDYPIQQKVTLENTYGMHFYTKLKVNHIETHYFVADDVPSIEAKLETKDGHRFLFFGVHPPPPSPTEEETSKERDGDLLSVAKKVRNSALPVVVIGDFNNVAWAKSSILFSKTSKLIDGRIGRGILATFHAKYWFFKIPLDLFFHSPDVYIDSLKILPPVGSDHFPVSCTFHIDYQSNHQEEFVEDLDEEQKKEVDELIEEGKEEESDNREQVASE
ncbi:endonuclease/exonuclease/phosphatase family protein [Sphingobacterium sp. UT-1RO-CII-1]|uniref:endonuclease/exonuclease/phosphatase family protein n=1 Tax=Sphingobacterium sp. UT-1RO-CII-1 TaxID=2995225 RepID=UPI00227C6AF0|nr:endonuclease/exonuclease/phosphatase family protein [Sphingobacterium sp. UT-1RO-CII-1]MCY4779158.1 endonuclease/exonuclease/phosphatase family protein [Sphingobacterium sp. UT-1RO-CII-1]